MIHLSPRLMALAQMVPPGRPVCDVGTDHASLPIWLWQNGVSDRLTATDLSEKPLKRAEANLRRFGLSEQIVLLQLDGLDGLVPSDYGAIVIAGLSGETIMSILAGHPPCAGVLYLLQPVTRAELLRDFLFKNGYVIERERLVRDERRIRTVIAAAKRTAPMAEPDTFYISQALLDGDDPLCADYVRGMIDRLNRESRALSHSSKLEDALRLDWHRRDLQTLSRIWTQLSDNHYVEC